MKKFLILTAATLLCGTSANAITYVNDTDHEVTFTLHWKKKDGSPVLNEGGTTVWPNDSFKIEPQKSLTHGTYQNAYTAHYSNMFHKNNADNKGGAIILNIVAKAEGTPEKSCVVEGKVFEFEVSGDPRNQEFKTKIENFDKQTLRYSSPEKGAWWNATCTVDK